MFRRKAIIPALMMAVLHLWTAGCENESDIGNVSDVKANLVIVFDPNPAEPAVEEAGVWRTTAILTETNGIGVNVYGMRLQRFALSGEETHDTIFDSPGDQALLEVSFLACDGGAEGNYIPPGGKTCMFLSMSGSPGFPGYGYGIVSFFGVDDLGNEVIFKGRVEMLD